MNGNNDRFWRIENSADSNGTGSEATLYIYGDIMQYDMEWWNWPDDVIPHRFRQELDSLANVNTIHVRINSGGGSVFGAYAIMNLLKSHKAKIITYNDGIAASAATIIAMAGDKIVSALGSIWMVHLPLTVVTGNANDLQKAAEILNTITESMLDVYHGRTGIPKAELLEMMKNDTWMTGREAKEKGFVDEVTDLEVVAYLSNDKATAFFNGLGISLTEVHNKEVLANMLKPAPPPHEATTETNSTETNSIQKEEKPMTVAELQENHPEIHTAVFNAGVEQGTAQGVQNERERIKAIDDLAIAGMEELTNKAKFETGMDAKELAMEIITAQKQKGINFLNQAQADAAHMAEIPAAGAPQDGTGQEEALLTHLANEAKNLK